jgi:hypothetical protein
MAGNSIAAPERALPVESPPTRARIVVVEDSRAVFAFSPDSEIVEEMVNRAITILTGHASPSASWRSLLSTKDTVGLKVFSSPGPTSGTRPAVVAAVIKGLLAAGLPPKQIVVWDKHLSDLRLAGYFELAERFGVEVAGSADEGYDGKVDPYDKPLLGNLVWGDFEFGKHPENVSRKSYISKLLTQRLTKVINITPLLNHNVAQVVGCLYSLAIGSIDNTLRFESSPDVLSQAVPEIYARAEIGDRVVLNIVDALICQYRGEERTRLHDSTMLCQIRMSTDPVALDALSIRELEHQRQLARVPPVRPNWQIYTNAAFMDLGVIDPHLVDVINIQCGARD